MTRTARANRDNARSLKTLPASSWEDLQPRSSKESFKFGTKNDTGRKRNSKQERSEKRRLKRAVDREQARVCFHCREEGHMVSDCPRMKDQVDHGSGICFKCGSTEHSLSKCRAKVPDGQLPYAKCFICNEMGHLSKSCPDNPKGLYPMGGCCDNCGSVEHFKKDCPETKPSLRGVEDFTLDKMDAFTNVEVEATLVTSDLKIKSRKTESVKKVKVVKF